VVDPDHVAAIGQPALDAAAGTHSMTSAPTGGKAMASVGSPAMGS
jgi:hypothetical protein